MNPFLLFLIVATLAAAISWLVRIAIDAWRTPSDRVQKYLDPDGRVVCVVDTGAQPAPRGLDGLQYHGWPTVQRFLNRWFGR